MYSYDCYHHIFYRTSWEQMIRSQVRLIQCFISNTWISGWMQRSEYWRSQHHIFEDPQFWNTLKIPFLSIIIRLYILYLILINACKFEVLLSVWVICREIAFSPSVGNFYGICEISYTPELVQFNEYLILYRFSWCLIV